MADVIFIQILRAYLGRVHDDGGAGFLGALRDPSTAAALGAMHHRPEAPWTVASLAEEVGLSRSVFAARFAQLVGEPPLGYLTRLRMQKAATMLRGRNACEGLAPDGLRVGGLVQPRVPPVGRRRAWCLPQDSPQVVSGRRTTRRLRDAETSKPWSCNTPSPTQSIPSCSYSATSDVSLSAHATGVSGP